MVYKNKFGQHIKGKEIDVLQILSSPDMYIMKTFEPKRQAMQKFTFSLNTRITLSGTCF